MLQLSHFVVALGLSSIYGVISWTVYNSVSSLTSPIDDIYFLLHLLNANDTDTTYTASISTRLYSHYGISLLFSTLSKDAVNPISY